MLNIDELINDFSKLTNKKSQTREKITISKNNFKNKNNSFITNLKEAKFKKFQFFYSEFLINIFPSFLCNSKFYKESKLKKKTFEILKNNFDKYFNYIYIIEKFNFLDDLNMKINKETEDDFKDCLNNSNIKPIYITK